MTRQLRRVTVSPTTIQKPSSGYHWKLKKIYINHVTGTNTALYLQPQEGDVFQLGFIGSSVTSGFYPVSYMEEMTIVANNYLIQQRLEVEGLDITPNEHLSMTGDSAARAHILVLEVSDDDASNKIGPAPPLSTAAKQPQRIEWWQ